MRRPYIFQLNTQKLGGLTVCDGFERPPRPHRRAAGHLAHQSIADPDLACQLLNIGLRREEAVRPALHNEAILLLGEYHTAGPSLGLEHYGIGARSRELPRRRQTGESCPHYGDGYS